MPYDKSKPYSCPCCGYWNGDMKYDYYKHNKKPLIKDEKIRKAVRAWADGHKIVNVQFDAYWRGFRHDVSTITVWKDLPLEDNKTYTIAELCGEEEE